MASVSDPRDTDGWKVSISQCFYKYGLFCSTHPWLIILITLSIFSFTCYPVLLNSDGFKIYGPSSAPSSSFQYYQSVPPYAIVQQIIVKSAVIPWKSNLILMDAVRAPLAQVFSLVEYISNFRVTEGSKVTSLNDLCLQINEPIASSDNTASNVLPRYSCLLISPANIWKNDINKFLQDTTIIKTIFNTKDFGYLDSGNLREILFGIPWMETGIRPFYVRNRQRTITYAITLVFSMYNKIFLENLATHLRERYPIDPFLVDKNQSKGKTDEKLHDMNQRMTYLHFQNEFSLIKSPALIATYIMLFFYIYFSVRKIDLIKCKWALAGSSLLTVILCLLMSLGICSWFDFNPPLNGREILPYLIVIISLENMLVLTQSIVSSPAHLDVKVRVAQGLSKGGQSVLKNLLIELGLLTFGYFTFVPVIQEYCLFGMIGLVSDFFLQFTFFTALLTVDIQRVEMNNCGYGKSIRSSQRRSNMNGLTEREYILSDSMSTQTNILSHIPEAKPVKLPKRLRLVHFWTQTRMVHRFLMICLVAWITILLFRSGIVDQLAQSEEELPSKTENAKVTDETITEIPVSEHSTFKDTEGNVEEDYSFHRIRHNVRGPGDILSPHHWSNLFGFYNISLYGKYISFLPPLHITIPVDPATAVKNRHPSDRDHMILRHFLYPGSIQPSYYDQNDDLDELPPGAGRTSWTPKEILLVLLFSTPTLICIVYIFVIMYKCMCSRRYDEWRSSWSSGQALTGASDDSRRKMDDYLLETILMKREAHQEEIELIACNERHPYIAVSSMSGNLTVWDVLSGECHLQVNRSGIKNTSTLRKSDSRGFKPHHKPTGSFSSDSTYGSCSSTNSGECIDHIPASDSPSLLAGSSSDPAKAGYNFAPFYSRMNSYKSHLSELIINAASNDSGASHNIDIPANIKRESGLDYQQIWCMDVHGRYILLGCAMGRLEIWDSLTGHNYHHQENDVGITVVKADGDRLVLGKLDGAMEIYQLTSQNGLNDRQQYHHVHSEIHHNSFFKRASSSTVVNVYLIHSFRAHSQPISSLQIEASHVITGGADHLVKVFKLETGMCAFTLHGHFGGITCLEVDKTNPNTALSGCKGGQVCLWDLATGTCFFNLEAHRDAAVTLLSATTLYVISAGTDNRINIWDKYSGNLVHSLPNQRSFHIGLLPLTQNILITAKDDHLIVWNISEASPLRVISLSSFGDHKKSTIKNLKIASVSRAVVCDYDQNICIMHFPGLTRKSD